MTEQLVTDAMLMAIWRRGPVKAFDAAALRASPAGVVPGVDLTDKDRDGTSRSSSS